MAAARRSARRTWLGLLTIAMLAASSLAGADATWPPKCAPPGPGGSWPQFGNQITGDRTQPKEFFITAPRAATLAPTWTFDANKGAGSTKNEITGYPIESDGCVYVGTNTG